MFPIPWNFPLRKKNGNLVNIGDAIDAGTEIPEHGETDAGKVLSVDANGDLEWSDEVSSEIQTLTNEVDTIVNDLSAKNLLKIDDALQTTSGITLSINDGVITLNGTSTEQIIFTLLNDYNSPIKSGSYIFNGLDDGSSNTISMVLNYYNSQGAEQPSAIAVNGDTLAAIPADYNGHLKIYLVIASGQTFNDKVIKPMIRPASIKDSTFVHYAMTNRELTENKAEKSDLASINITGTTNNTGATIKSGTYFYLNGTLVEAINDIATDASLTLNTNYKIITAGALNVMRLKTASIEFEASDFSSQNGGLVAYKNIAADIENSSLIESVFVSSLEGVYNSCSCGLRVIDSNTMYLVAKTFDTTAAKVKIQIKYRTY